jgi:DNA-binding NarL/FixJ family response regulator
MSLRVFLVHDEPAVQKGVEILLGREKDMSVCGKADNAQDALLQVRTLQPDIAIIDPALAKGDGLKLIRELRAGSLKLKILVFSMYNQADHIRAALDAGADGYVIKEEGAAKLIEAIRAVAAGTLFLTEATVAKLGGRMHLRPGGDQKRPPV